MPAWEKKNSVGVHVIATLLVDLGTCSRVGYNTSNTN
jgi:hypothetical protein